jgi:hypothetical protein
MSALSRRSLVTSAAALPALAVPAVAVAACAEPDPIYAAIAAHQRFAAEWYACVSRECDLPKDEFLNKTPRYVEAQQATETANDRMDDAACALSGIEPTSVAGVMALLSYYAEIESKGEESIFPTSLVDADDPAVSESWGATYGYFIARNAARALGKLAVQS